MSADRSVAKFTFWQTWRPVVALNTTPSLAALMPLLFNRGHLAPWTEIDQ